MLGFGVVEGNESYINPQQFQEIRGWVTGPKVVAEIYGIADARDLPAILENYRPDYLELGVREFDLLKVLPLPFILSVAEHETVAGSPEFILTKKNVAPPNQAVKQLVTIGSKEDVHQVLMQSGVYGVALKGGVELRPGLKEYDDLSEVFDLLEADD